MSKFKVGDKVICSVDHTAACYDFGISERAFIGTVMTIMSDEGLSNHPDDSYYVKENGSYWMESWLELVDPRYCPKPQTTPMPESKTTPCKLYEIPDYQNIKVRWFDWDRKYWIKREGKQWKNQSGNSSNRLVHRFDEEIWLPYGEAKDDKHIEELRETMDSDRLIVTCVNHHNKINEIIRRMNEEKK